MNDYVFDIETTRFDISPWRLAAMGQSLIHGSEQNATDEILVMVSEGSELFGNHIRNKPPCGVWPFAIRKVCNMRQTLFVPYFTLP